jgi:hypothetical protein
VHKETPPGTMIATGWNPDGTYPNNPATGGTGIYAGGNSYWSQNNDGGGPWKKQSLRSGWSEVNSKARCDRDASGSSISANKPNTNQ